MTENHQKEIEEIIAEEAFARPGEIIPFAQLVEIPYARLADESNEELHQMSPADALKMIEKRKESEKTEQNDDSQTFIREDHTKKKVSISRVKKTSKDTSVFDELEAIIPTDIRKRLCFLCDQYQFTKTYTGPCRGYLRNKSDGKYDFLIFDFDSYYKENKTLTEYFENLNKKQAKLYHKIYTKSTYPLDAKKFNVFFGALLGAGGAIFTHYLGGAALNDTHSLLVTVFGFIGGACISKAFNMNAKFCDIKQKKYYNLKKREIEVKIRFNENQEELKADKRVNVLHPHYKGKQAIEKAFQSKYFKFNKDSEYAERDRRTYKSGIYYGEEAILRAFTDQYKT